MSTPSASTSVHWLFVNVNVPATLMTLTVENDAQLSPLASPTLFILLFVKLKFVTEFVPNTPWPSADWMFMLLNEGLATLLSDMPLPVVLWIVPPELSPP